MSKMFQVYGIGQALIPVLPPPLPFQNPPTSTQTNYEIGQLVYSPSQIPTAFYLYSGAGNWVQLATGGSGGVTSVLGTAGQIAVTTVSGVATVSLPAAITAPGSLTTTTSLAAGTTVTAGTGLIATTGGVTASAGNIVATLGNISATAGSVSAGTSVTAGTSITATLGNITATNGNLVLGTAGNKISIATGANASIGTSAAMVAGTITVSTTAVTAASKIFLSTATPGGTQGFLSVGTIVPGTSFVINSSGATDTSTVNWWIIN